MKSMNAYNQKRNFSKTKEPEGKVGKVHQKLRFVVQHHLARKDHYDFRLEWNGVLKSWAVPKGPSYNPKDKRLAVEVEDHPFSYRNFEGVIPKGEYGGGIVMLWDEGFWTPLEDVGEGLKNGSLKFMLYGKRLFGKWTLVRFKENNWLLLKEDDSTSGYFDIKSYDRSIKTGRTMEEISEKIKSVTNVVDSVLITNPEKIIISNIKKIDIAEYYDAVSLRMMPFLKNRLISTIRCPDGAGGTCFFKKHFEDNNKNLGKIVLKKNGKSAAYYYALDKQGLIREVQMNGFEFHIWGSSVKEVNHPDMMVFDLDPDEKLSLKKIREGVKDLKSILDELHLVSFLKTSGGKGYHVVVPLKSIKSWNKFREVAKNIAMLMEARWPLKYVANMKKENRKNKIFIDWMRNIKGATSVCPYSVRLRKRVSVSMPIQWSELDKVKPNEITMDMAIKRLKKKDPWENFFAIIQ